MCQSSTIQAAIFLKDHVLPKDFERNIRDLWRLAVNRKERRHIASLVVDVSLEMPPTISTKAGISLENRRIVLPFGFLSARWCSTYRILSLLKGRSGFEVFQQIQPVGPTFAWPADVPKADDGSAGIAIVNKIYPYVILATILHEIGHIVHRKRHVFGMRLELACDAFAIDYLQRSSRSEYRKILTTALAIWTCCLCSESLMYTEYDLRLHPSPARRMEQLFAIHLSRFHGRNMNAIRLLCVSHLVNLAKIRREEIAQEIHDRNYESHIARVHALRKCWGPGA